MRRFRLLLRWIPLIALVSLGCGREPARVDNPGAAKLRVVTSFLPMQAHTRAITGDLAIVEQLLSGDTGPHDFQLTPSDVRRVADADLLIVNGAGLEAWLDDLIASVGRPGLQVVDASADLRLRKNPPALGGTDAGEPGGNPHTWLDPVLCQQQVRTILDALRQADPGNEAAYEANSNAYLERLRDLDAEFRAVLDPLPAKNLVTFHDAFPYLAARYGLHYVGCVAEFPEKDPSPAQLAALLDAIRDANAHVLFAESGYAPELLKRIADQTGAKVSELDTLEIGQGDASAYLDRMRANLAALQAAFARPRPQGP